MQRITARLDQPKKSRQSVATGVVESGLELPIHGKTPNPVELDAMRYARRERSIAARSPGQLTEPHHGRMARPPPNIEAVRIHSGMSPVAHSASKDPRGGGTPRGPSDSSDLPGRSFRMPQGHARGAARPSQPETTLPHDTSSAVYVASLVGGGIFPPTGEFTLAVWARLSNRSEDTVREWLDSRNVPYTRRFGDRYYDAVDIAAASKKVTRDQDPENARHGGRRVKKAS